ncbi:hypothetical protein ACFY12_34345 [Streptomyces sp. NPDC001339]|uniref:hypothetical protein n=1 Tax=Streptomyces sp. NPDC001339 TaxID=3364563 RepID=UPI0036A158DA
MADARIAIDMWEERAVATTKVEGRIRQEDRWAYEQVLAAGHPTVEPLDYDPAARAQQLRDNLDQAHERRTELAAQTLGFTEAGTR